MLFKSFKIQKCTNPVKYSTPINNIIKVDDSNFKTNIKISKKNIKVCQKPLLILKPTVNDTSDEDTLNRRRVMWKQLTKNGISLMKKKNN